MSAAPVAQSALHDPSIACGARVQACGAWQIPVDFGSVDAELAAARTAVGMGERCGAKVWEIEGQTLGELAARLGVGEVPVGAAALVTLPENQAGRWCRLTPSRARVLPDPVGAGVQDGSIGIGPLLALLGSPPHAAGACLHATDLSSGLTTLLILGPRCPDLLARLVRLDVDPSVFGDRTLALTGAAGVPLQLLRWDRAALPAYELFVGRDVAEYFWGALAHAGEDLGLKPIGSDALTRLLAQ